MVEFRTETDSLGQVSVPADKLWGAQTQRSLEHFSIGKDLIPAEMIHSYEAESHSSGRPPVLGLVDLAADERLKHVRNPSNEPQP
jgi:fumarate hydratase class II